MHTTDRYIYRGIVGRQSCIAEPRPRTRLDAREAWAPVVWHVWSSGFRGLGFRGSGFGVYKDFAACGKHEIAHVYTGKGLRVES